MKNTFVAACGLSLEGEFGVVTGKTEYPGGSGLAAGGCLPLFEYGPVFALAGGSGLASGAAQASRARDVRRAPAAAASRSSTSGADGSSLITRSPRWKYRS